MGLYDRDYVREGYQGRRYSTPLGGIRMWSVNTCIIALCIGVYVLDQVLLRLGYVTLLQQADGQVRAFRPLEGLGMFTTATAIFHLQVWRFITFQFLHANFNHILFNMIALYFFGPMIESYLGSKRYLAFYLVCGLAGPVMYIVFWALGFLIRDPNVPMVGASAGIFGVLVAGAILAPNATVLIYGIFPMRLKVMALLMLAVAAYTVWTGGPNAGGEAAHLGGAAMGYFLIRRPHLLDVGLARANRRFAPPY
jgi:membrane associated rhomboid family serine protease